MSKQGLFSRDALNNHDAQIPVALWVLTAAMAMLLFIGFAREAPVNAHGMPHASIREMNQGGDPSRHDGLVLLAGLYGACQITFMTACLWLGVRRDRARIGPILVGGAIYLTGFIALVMAYANTKAGLPFAFGISLSATLLVSMWMFPIPFVVLYMLNFHTWVYNDDDKQRFSQLMHRSHDAASTGPRADG